MTVCLERLFLLLIVSLGLMWPWAKLGGLDLQVTELLFVAVGAMALGLILFRRRTFEVSDSIRLLAFVVAGMAASAIFSADPAVSGLKFVGLCYLAGLTLLTIWVVDSTAILKRVLIIWIATSALVGVVGTATVVLFYLDATSGFLSYSLHHYGSLPPGWYPRVQATFVYPAMLCNYLTVGSVLTLSVWRCGWLGKKAAGLLLFPQLVTAFFTFTPGLGGLIFALAIVAADTMGPRKTIGRVMIGAGAMSAAAATIVATLTYWPIETSPYVFEILGRRVHPSQRLLTWESALRTFGSSPIFGRGIGLPTASVIFRAPSGQLQMLTDAHNTWISIAASSGSLGLGAFTGLFIHVVRKARFWSNVAGGLSPIHRSLIVAFVSCFAVQGLVGSFEDARHIWVLMGLVVAASKMSAKKANV